MYIIGLAGPARSGKDTVAKHLVKAHGFLQFSFSDMLYEEVAAAFQVDKALLYDARTKDIPSPLLKTSLCKDETFAVLAEELIWREEEDKAGSLSRRMMPWSKNLSPRWVLQKWGTEYRRAQNEDYWINCAADWVRGRMIEVGPDAMALRLVNTSVRYPNEVEWIRSFAGAAVWHVRRRDCPRVEDHPSEVPVPVDVYRDNVIHNNGSIHSLWTAVTMLLGSHGQEVFVEHEEVEPA